MGKARKLNVFHLKRTIGHFVTDEFRSNPSLLQFKTEIEILYEENEYEDRDP